MRFLRLVHGGIPYWARWLDDETCRLWTDAPYLPNAHETDRLVPLRPDHILAPATPSKIVCVGRNYAAHAKELGNEVPKEPLLFFKPPSALLSDQGIIKIPPQSQRVEYEGELAVVIGTTLRNATETEALAAVFAITAANDVTARDLQKADVQFTRAKGFDSFCPLGPYCETDFPALDTLILQTRKNGNVVQSGSTADMVFPVPTLISYISQVMTLLPGDVVLTGTPEGVGPLQSGDTIEVDVAGIVLSNRVA